MGASILFNERIGAKVGGIHRLSAKSRLHFDAAKALQAA